MNFRTLIIRSLRYHWRAHLGVVLGAAIGSAALVGALVVGDSVRGSLREQALERIGATVAKLEPLERTFSEVLGQNTESGYKSMLSPRNWSGGRIHPFLIMPGVASTPDGSARASRVQLFGIGTNFCSLGGEWWQPLPPPGSVVLNDALASRLGVKRYDEVLLRIPRPSALSREVSVATRADAAITMRLRIHGVAPVSALGNLSLIPHQSPPLNAFVPLAALQEAAGLSNRANLLLLETLEVDAHRRISRPEALLRGLFGFITRRHSRVFVSPGGRGLEVRAERDRDLVDASQLANHAVRSAWSLDDTESQLQLLPTSAGVELRTPRIFLDPPVVRSALAADTNAQPILTYLVNLLTAGSNSTPYSMVTAAGAPWTPADLRGDEVVVSQWLADDLQVQPGDEIKLVYFDPESGAQLIEHTNAFRVRNIVPMEMPWPDRTLMPDFPGIEKAESTRDWDAGFPLVHEIRRKDDDYWRDHRGTPKAFIALAAGQRMWGNRFGELTAIRFPIPTSTALPLSPALSPSDGERENSLQPSATTSDGTNAEGSSESSDGQELLPLLEGEGRGEGERTPPTIAPPHVIAYKEALEEKILAGLKPEELGLRFEPVREQALRAAEESQDFGGLFLGFSFFLIAAALLLMALLFQFGLEQRAPEIGTLLSLGFTPQQVRRLLLGEGLALALLGGVAGAVGGIYFAKGMLHGLATVWRDAVAATALDFHVTGQTLIIGLSASVAVSFVTIWLALQKFVRRPARELLTGDVQSPESGVPSLKSKVIAVGALLMALGLVGWTLATGDTANAGAFFGAGALVLVAGLSFASAWLQRRAGFQPARPGEVTAAVNSGGSGRLEAGPTLASLALHGCARRRKRSLATVAMLACGSFLIVSIGVFRLDANQDATKKTSGTGGFALIGETTMPVVQDLNREAGRDFFALSERDMEGVGFVPFRVREGDEASCLNLNRAQKPRLLGVKPEMLEGRFAFAKGEGWDLLRSSRREEAHSEKSKFDESLLTSAATTAIPAIGDANSIQWAMGKKVGDTIDYVDERGQPFQVRIVGAVANSILQGQLIIDEAAFVQRFPGESGFRMFLMDAPSNRVAEVSATLSRAMQDVGLELTPAAQRLAQFNAVQNTYLGTFQVLGGLGLLLGSVGLGIVVLRNVLERRGELALLMAVGFRKPTVQRLLLIENGALLLTGLALGVVAAAVAVLPAVLSPSAELPAGSLAVTLGAVLLNGVLWTWAATRVAVRGDLLAALRNE